jgi:endoglucanase
MSCALGKGAAIKAMDRGTIVSPALREFMIAQAEANGIPYQMEVLRWGATDAMAIQSTRGGVPVGVISIPTRYAHSPSEMAHLGDYDAALRLTVALAQADHASLLERHGS